MSEQTTEGDRLYIRTSRAFKHNTASLIAALYRAGYRDDDCMTAYVLEAIREKRARDTEKLHATPRKTA